MNDFMFIMNWVLADEQVIGRAKRHKLNRLSTYILLEVKFNPLISGETIYRRLVASPFKLPTGRTKVTDEVKRLAKLGYLSAVEGKVNVKSFIKYDMSRQGNSYLINLFKDGS